VTFAIGLFWQATVTTVTITIAAGVFGVSLSALAGTARLSPYRSIRVITGIYVEIFRGTSVLVQLFWLFYVLPTFGIVLSPWLAGVLALGLNFASYGAEIVRSGLEAVPRGQWDAAQALNMTAFDRLRLVIFPQALPIMIPAMTSNLIDLLKASSLLSLIAALDLTHVAQQLVAVGYLNITLGYGLVLASYFVLAVPIVALGRFLEARTGRHLALRAVSR
jgi:polar amino acid transport system permease protein